MLKKSSVFAGIFIILFFSRAYSENLLWDDFNEKLEARMNSRFIFNLEDYSRPPYLSHFDSPYGIRENKFLSKIENIIEKDTETSLIFALERYWRRERIDLSDILDKPKIGVNKETRVLELRIKTLEEELRDAKEHNRVKDTKTKINMELKLRELKKELTEKKVTEFGLDTALIVQNFSEWEIALGPFFKTSFGHTINKISVLYYSHSDIEKLKLETTVLLPQNTDLLINNMENLTEGDWESEIKIKRWITNAVSFDIGHKYLWTKEIHLDSIGFAFLVSDNLRINFDQKYEWKNQEYFGQITLRRDF